MLKNAIQAYSKNQEVKFHLFYSKPITASFDLDELLYCCELILLKTTLPPLEVQLWNIFL